MTAMVVVGIFRTFEVVSVDGSLDDETDRLMEAMLDLEDDTIYDSAVSADLGKNIIEMELVATGATFEEALARGDSAMRAAIHAVGGDTSNWDVITVSQHAELVDA